MRNPALTWVNLLKGPLEIEDCSVTFGDKHPTLFAEVVQKALLVVSQFL